ncbi:DUF4384 domain-containing protein [Seohaeicola saemankumensis]|nr:DUF4384 domain-containing protein [Seohaeicola saemankumensis]MCA0872563.1 DUF4384 domain-containing protein [Seohaeicola saemankumensis]
MTPRLPVWAAGVAGSVLAHGVLLAVLALAIWPDPVSRQPMPDSELEVQAHVLERSTAREQPARGDPAAEARATGSSLAQGAVQTSRAQTVERPQTVDLTEARATPDTVPPGTPVTERLAADTPQPQAATPVAQDGNRVPLATPAAETVAASATPEPAPVALSAPEAAPVTARPVTGAVVPGAVPSAAPLVAAVTVAPAVAARAAPAVTLAAFVAAPPRIAPRQTEATPASPATPQLAAWAAARPDSPAAAQQDPAATAAPQARPKASRIKAALAFSGDRSGDVDPVSLAAFQSFMRPGDAMAEADPLRDGVAAVLSQVPCSRLQVSFDPETTTLSVNGHVPEDGLRGPVLAALRAQMGADIAVSDNMLILPRPQCGALSGIAAAGLPQSTDQITNPLLIGVDTHARVFRFTEGKLLSLDMTAPDYDAYIYLDYFDAGGDVLHLEPNEFAPLRHARAQEVQQIGARTMQDQGLKLVVGPPFGQEIAVAFAASEPLYDGLRPMVEPAADYLEWLRERVAEKRRDNPAFKGEWVYFFVATSAR